MASPGSAGGTTSSTRYWRCRTWTMSPGSGRVRRAGAAGGENAGALAPLPPGAEQAGHEGGTGPAGVVEAMGTARGPQLVAAERAQELGQCDRWRRGQSFDLGFLGAARWSCDAELAPHRGETRFGQDLEDAPRAGLGHGAYPSPEAAGPSPWNAAAPSAPRRAPLRFLDDRCRQCHRFRRSCPVPPPAPAVRDGDAAAHPVPRPRRAGGEEVGQGGAVDRAHLTVPDPPLVAVADDVEIRVLGDQRGEDLAGQDLPLDRARRRQARLDRGSAGRFLICR